MDYHQQRAAKGLLAASVLLILVLFFAGPLADALGGILWGPSWACSERGVCDGD